MHKSETEEDAFCDMEYILFYILNSPFCPYSSTNAHKHTLTDVESNSDPAGVYF